MCLALLVHPWLAYYYCYCYCYYQPDAGMCTTSLLPPYRVRRRWLLLCAVDTLHACTGRSSREEHLTHGSPAHPANLSPCTHCARVLACTVRAW